VEGKSLHVGQSLNEGQEFMVAYYGDEKDFVVVE